MTGIGLFLVFLGYTIVYWGVNAIQRKDQDTFAAYLLLAKPTVSTKG